MKIIIPILGFGRAGGNRVLSQLANEWLQMGHTVSFLCPDSSDDPYFPTTAEILWVDGAGKPSKVRGTITKPSGSYHLKSLYRGLESIGIQYDVILANHSLTAWPVALASCGNARKMYYVQAYEPEYYTSSHSIKGYILATLSALSYHLPLHRIVNAPIYFRYKNLHADQFVPPGLDLATFKPTETIKSLENAATIVIGCIGRHEPEKGIIFVLRAFEEIVKKDKRFLLKVAYGNLPANWQHEKCEIIKPKNDLELANFYRSLDILVAPGTVQHGAPHYPVLEAGACGVAVVTTGYMGATLDTAWIVANKSVESIVNAINNIIANDDQRLKKAIAFLKVAQDFSWPIVANKMLRLLNTAD